MNDSQFNRLTMFQTSLRTLNEYKEVWLDQPPRIFSTKVQQAIDAVGGIESLAREQEADQTGVAESKQRQAAELEESGYLFGSTLAIWFEEQEDPRHSQVELSPADWRRLRNQQLLEKARLVRVLWQDVLSSDHSNAAEEWGVTQTGLETLSTEIEEYAQIIAGPQQAIAQRKALTTELVEKFREVSQQFDVLDKLILHFGLASSTGRDLVSAYQASRIIRDLGSRRAADQPIPATTAN